MGRGTQSAVTHGDPRRQMSLANNLALSREINTVGNIMNFQQGKLTLSTLGELHDPVLLSLCFVRPYLTFLHNYLFETSETEIC